jgi:hypothetical protein
MPADRVVTARFHGGQMTGPPTFVCIHSAETPLADSYVASIAEFFRQGPAAGTSAHHMTGPHSWIQLLPEDVVAYAAGPKANSRGVHVEQTGRASLTRAQWCTPDGMALHATTARCASEACARWGIPVRWATDAQLKAAAAGQAAGGGLVTHGQVARVLGGTTHTDPGPGYPADVLLETMQQEEDDMAGYGQQVWEFLTKGNRDPAGRSVDAGQTGRGRGAGAAAAADRQPRQQRPYAGSADRLQDLWLDGSGWNARWTIWPRSWTTCWPGCRNDHHPGRPAPSITGHGSIRGR